MTKDYKTKGFSLSLEIIEQLKNYADEHYRGNESMAVEELLKEAIKLRKRIN